MVQQRRQYYVSQGLLPSKKNEGNVVTFLELKKRFWYLLVRPTSKGPTAGAFAVPFKIKILFLWPSQLNKK